MAQQMALMAHEQDALRIVQLSQFDICCFRSAYCSLLTQRLGYISADALYSVEVLSNPSCCCSFQNFHAAMIDPMLPAPHFGLIVRSVQTF